MEYIKDQYKAAITLLKKAGPAGLADKIDNFIIITTKDGAEPCVREFAINLQMLHLSKKEEVWKHACVEVERVVDGHYGHQFTDAGLPRPHIRDVGDLWETFTSIYCAKMREEILNAVETWSRSLFQSSIQFDKREHTGHGEALNWTIFHKHRIRAAIVMMPKALSSVF